MRFSIKNFGCRTNLAEAMEWSETLSGFGYVYTPNLNNADILIFNSCVLTKNAENEVRRLLNKIKKKNPHKFVILTGCLTDSLKSDNNFLVIDNWIKGEVPQKILERFGKYQDSKNVKIRARANVKIQEGCNFNCSFCIIPYVRGGSRSTDEEKIIDMAKNFVDKGFKEIVITGTHLNSWGIDLRPRKNLSHLLKKLNRIEGLKRIRLSSLDPRFLNGHFLESLSEISKIAPHFHLSLQSCSDEVLKRMNRKGGSEMYTQILNFLREKFPSACIGADIIVGFSYENDNEFAKTYNFLKNSPVNYLHVFPFSPREGTLAFSMPQVPDDIKKKRAEALRELSMQKKREFYSQFEGKKLPGIVIKKSGERAEVLTDNYIKVIVNLEDVEEGDEIYVSINRDNVSIARDFEQFK